MNRRALHPRRHQVTWIVLGTAALVTLDIGAWIAWALVHVVVTLAPALVLGAAAMAGWRWWRRRPGGQPRPPRVVRGSVVPSDDRLAAVTAERDDLRLQVAKLEGDAARTDQLLDDLERAAGRPVEAILASYQKIQRQYGPAAAGKTGGSQ